MRILLALALSVFFATPSFAQTTPDPWDVRLELGFNGAAGNSSFAILRTGASAKHIADNRYSLDFSTVVRYGRSHGEVIANDAAASVKVDWRPRSRLSPFLFVDALRDEVRRLDFQTNGGVGARWTLLDGSRRELAVSLAALWDYQAFASSGQAQDPSSESRGRWSVSSKASRKIGGVSVENRAVFQPVWDDFHDYVVQVTTKLSTKLLEDLSLAMEHLYLHDEVPPPGAGPDDQKFSILFQFAL